MFRYRATASTVAAVSGAALSLTFGLSADAGTAAGPEEDRLASPTSLAASESPQKERITVVGTRISQGTAVDCPKLRADDGSVHSVSYLAPAVAIGERVSVTGFYAHVTHCVGEVLHVEEARSLEGE